MKKRLQIVDNSTTVQKVLFESDPKQFGQAAVSAVLRDKTGDDFLDWGRNLASVDKARAWLTDRRNWFEGETHVLRWDGLVPKISSKHGNRLVQEWWDDGLAVVVVVAQRSIRSGQKEKDEIPSGEE